MSEVDQNTSGVEQRIAGRQPGEESGGSNIWKILGIGCGGGCLIIIIAAIIAGVYVARHAKGLIATFVEKTVLTAVDQSSLPPDQKASITRDVKRLTAAAKGGELTNEQTKQLLEQLMAGPLMPYILLRAVEVKHVIPSDLTPEEKQQASREIQRFIRGVVEGKIPSKAANEVIATVSTPGANQQPQIKETVSEEEVRAFVQAVKKRADVAEIPDEPYEINVAEEIHKIVVDAIGEETEAEAAPAREEEGAAIPTLLPVG